MKKIFINNYWIDVERGYTLDGTECIFFETHISDLYDFCLNNYLNKNSFVIVLRVDSDMEYKTVKIWKETLCDGILTVDLEVLKDSSLQNENVQ